MIDDRNEVWRNAMNISAVEERLEALLDYLMEKYPDDEELGRLRYRWDWRP